MQEIQHRPSKIFLLAIEWLQSLFCMEKKGGGEENDPLHNSVSSMVKGIYFIINVVLPKQILFLNLSLS